MTVSARPPSILAFKLMCGRETDPRMGSAPADGLSISRLRVFFCSWCRTRWLNSFLNVSSMTTTPC